MAEHDLTDAEFDTWITPSQTVELAPGDEPLSRRRWVMSRLKTGAFVAVARKAGRDGDELKPFIVVPKSRWASWNDDGEYDFWRLGDAVFTTSGRGGYGASSTTRYLDVRIEPESIGRPVAAPSASPAPKGDPERKHLSKDDAERFARALLHGWPGATDEYAHTKAVAFFAENKVPRDWFRGIFRAIRGPRSPGRKVKIDK